MNELREALPEIKTETLPGPKAAMVIARRKNVMPDAIRCVYPCVMERAQGAIKMCIRDRCYSRFVDVIALRALSHPVLTAFAKESGVPVLNGASDLADPCGALADLMTIRERYGSFQGLRLCYAGPAGAAANSLIAGALSLGMEVAALPVPCRATDGQPLDGEGWTNRCV